MYLKKELELFDFYYHVNAKIREKWMQYRYVIPLLHCMFEMHKQVLLWLKPPYI